MKNIERILKNELLSKWDSGKVLIILGPRQVGKTTLVKQICEGKGKFLFLNGDDPEIRTLLEDAGEKKLRQIIGNEETVFIDEAQRIKNIGLTAKIIHDQIENVRVILSGSSAFEIASNTSEPLTGRKWEYLLYPVSWQELVNYSGFADANTQLNIRLVFGMYPEVIIQQTNAQEILRSLSGSYLYKDLLQYGGIRKPELLEKLLTALALQLGSEVNYNELAGLLRIDRNTIENYISLLEKAFVIFKLQPLARNIRNELNTGRKIYFYDNGVRNALLGDFKPVELRSDIGALWENFLMSERLKYNAYRNWYGHSHFWRTYQQQEIDYIEEADAKFYAYEFKWNKKAKAKFPKTFTKNYNIAEKKLITPENFEEFVM